MRRKIFKTRCPKCDKQITYYPPPGFIGRLRCPHCAHDFKIPTLLDFSMKKIITVYQNGNMVPVESDHFVEALQR